MKENKSGLYQYEAYIRDTLGYHAVINFHPNNSHDTKDIISVLTEGSFKSCVPFYYNFSLLS